MKVFQFYEETPSEYAAIASTDTSGEILINDHGGVSVDDMKILADSLNVHQETGLTPRQLAEQRAGLLDALIRIMDIPNKDVGSDWEEIEEAREIAYMAVKKLQVARS